MTLDLEIKFDKYPSIYLTLGTLLYSGENDAYGKALYPDVIISNLSTILALNNNT